MSEFDPTQAEILISDVHNFLAFCGVVILHVRAGDQTVHSVDAVTSALQLARARKGRALLTVLESTATVPEAAVRARQVLNFHRLIRHEGSHSAMVVVADTVKGSIQKTIWQSLAIGFSRFGVFGTVPEAAAWLSKKSPSMSKEGMSAMAEWGRAHIRALRARGG